MVSSSAPMYTGARANVSVVVSAKEMSTSSGNRKAAICATEFLTTEIARSERPFDGEHEPRDVLDGVARDRDDHEAREGLGDVELGDRRLRAR